MYLGNVGPLAGIEVLFDALKIAKLPNVRLVVAGSGSAKKVCKRKQENMQIVILSSGMFLRVWFL